jgi:hypothetical protein
MNKYTLSKSDFKLASTCPTKLYYKKKKYHQNTEGNEYLEMLAEGGYMVGLLATLLKPGGIEIKAETTEEAKRLTDEYLRQENVTLYEPAIQPPGTPYIIRVDILEKRGNRYRLIEVKAKSWDSAAIYPKSNGMPVGLTFPNKKTGKPFSDYKEYLEDVAFQTWVLQQYLGEDAIIEPYLMLPDKARTTQLDGMNGLFSIKGKANHHGFKSYDVQFHGNVEDLLKEENNIMVEVDCGDIVKALLRDVSERAKAFRSMLEPTLRRSVDGKIPLTNKCKTCEFRLGQDAEKNGFAECWGNKAFAEDHILDFCRLGNVVQHKRLNFEEFIKTRFRMGEMHEDEIARLIKDDGTPYLNNRPLWHATQKTELIQPELRDAIAEWQFPLHFIDFETSRMALPYHAGMRPYGQVAFQWSCHTIHQDGRIEHQEWINTEQYFPNVAFASSLKDCIGYKGTVLMWSHHENSVLKDIADYLSITNEAPDVLDWIKTVAKMHDGDTTRLVDMNDLAVKYYYHPYTKGRTSIKVTLPAILQNCQHVPAIRELLESFTLATGEACSLYQLSDDGKSLDSPYKHLPAVGIIDGDYGQGDEEENGSDYTVNEGTAAMRAYQDLMFGELSRDPEKKTLIKNALLNYCKLDTLAMVLIYEYWKA